MSLRPQGLWIPGLLEAKALDAKGKLENGVYRDLGGVLSSGKGSDVTNTLLESAGKLNLEIPLIIPFRALNYHIDRGKVSVSFVESPQGIISGEEARAKISSLDYNHLDFQEPSGFLRLERHGDCGSYSSGDVLDLSLYGGRIDWVCGIEVSPGVLRKANELLIERKCNELRYLKRTTLEQSFKI